MVKRGRAQAKPAPKKRPDQKAEAAKRALFAKGGNSPIQDGAIHLHCLGGFLTFCRAAQTDNLDGFPPFLWDLTYPLVPVARG